MSIYLYLKWVNDWLPVAIEIPPNIAWNRLNIASVKFQVQSHYNCVLKSAAVYRKKNSSYCSEVKWNEMNCWSKGAHKITKGKWTCLIGIIQFQCRQRRPISCAALVSICASSKAASERRREKELVVPAASSESDFTNNTVTVNRSFRQIVAAFCDSVWPQLVAGMHCIALHLCGFIHLIAQIASDRDEQERNSPNNHSKYLRIFFPVRCISTSYSLLIANTQDTVNRIENLHSI